MRDAAFYFQLRILLRTQAATLVSGAAGSVRVGPAISPIC